jgi:putative redox protein
MQVLGFALAGCMSADLVHILTKGRHSFRALRTRLVAERAPDNPHRFFRVTLHFDIEGNVPADAVDRAIVLSREKYCSVWHSMRQDIELSTSFDVKPSLQSP